MPFGVEAVVETVRTEAPDPPGARETVPRLNDTVGPLATTGETAPVRVTVPERPVLFNVTMEVVELPARILLGLAALAEMEKLPVTRRLIATEWDSEPLATVTVTAYEPAGVKDVAEMVRVEFPVPPGDNVSVAGLDETVGPPGTRGERAAEKTRVPDRPRLFRVTVNLPEEPAAIVRAFELAEILKSPFTVRGMLTECLRNPLAPATVTR